MDHSDPCFGFEADFNTDLRCIPMVVRRKLDLAGVKLKLVHWGELSPPERQELVDWRDDPGAMAALREHLLRRTAQLSAGPAKALPPALEESWQQDASWPQAVLASCQQLGLEPDPSGWSRLSELQRFALVKLSHPGHEHRNLPLALAEFGVLRI